MSKITKDETGQFITLVRENVAFYHQSSDDYNTSSSLKQTSNNGFELSGAVNNAGKKGGKCRAFSMHKDNQKTHAIPHAVFAHTKLLPDAVTHAVSLSVSIYLQMDSGLKSQSSKKMLWA